MLPSVLHESLGHAVTCASTVFVQLSDRHEFMLSDMHWSELDLDPTRTPAAAWGLTAAVLPDERALFFGGEAPIGLGTRRAARFGN